MNKIEFVLMNNPVRRFIQAHLEVKRIKEIAAIPKKLPNVLEIGCGSGFGTKLIKKHFLPQHIDAIDLDPKMITLATKRWKSDSSVNCSVGDASALEFPSNHFDAIFDFGIIHHIPNWEDCIDELYRVTKPGGHLILEDLSIETFSTLFGRFLKKILVHPYKEMFTKDELISRLKKVGFKIDKKVSYNPLGLLPYFVITAQKPVHV